MSYSNGWSISTPTDPSAAKLLGADIRQLRLDLEERMETNLVVDWAADPIVLQDLVIGKRLGIRVVQAFMDIVPAVTADPGTGHVSLANGITYGIPVRVPVGCTILSMECMASVTTGTLTISLMRRQQVSSAPGASTVFSFTNVGPGLVNSISGAISHTIDAAYYYWVTLFHNAAACTFNALAFNISRPSSDFAT